MTDRIKGYGSIATTILVFIIVFWWLIVVAYHVGSAPVTNSSGAVTLDTFQRTKDILLVVLPLATTAVGFWIGNQSATQAQQTAEAATTSAQVAEGDVAR